MKDKDSSWLDIFKYTYFVLQLKIEVFLLNRLIGSSTGLYQRSINKAVLRFLESYETANEYNYEKFLKSVEKSVEDSDDESFKDYSDVYLNGFKAHYNVERNMRVIATNELKKQTEELKCESFLVSFKNK